MNNNINLIIGAIILICIDIVNTEDYDDKPAEDERSGSVDSESNEVYNVSLKETPIRDKKAELKGGVNDVVIPSSKYSKSEQPLTSSTINDGHKQAHLRYYPYSVSIQKKGAHYASGALIHKKWILTVAGEFYNIRETIKLFRARLGSLNCKKGGDLVPLKRIEIHPSYVHKQPGFDLAMLRFGHFVQCSNNVRPINLSSMNKMIAKAKFLTTYWPRLLVSGKVLPQSAKERLKHSSMRVSTQKMIPWNKCYGIMQTYNYTLYVSSLCLEPILAHHSPCMPDVGAPVIFKDGLWGITSGWTPDDCLTYNSPVIFNRISTEPTKTWLDELLDEGIKIK